MITINKKDYTKNSQQLSSWLLQKFRPKQLAISHDMLQLSVVVSFNHNDHKWQDLF